MGDEAEIQVSGPSVFEYTDYRSFLKDAFQVSRSRRHGWSYGSWAKRLGLRGSSMLTMILKGERNPGDRLVQAFAKGFRLNPHESEYFADLVELYKCRGNARMSVLLMEKLSKRYHGSERKFIDHETFSTISNWYYFAIREMVQLPFFRPDPEWICRQLRFRISPREAKEAIRVLLRLGLLKHGPKGRLTLGDGNIETIADVASEGVKRFHEQALENAKQSLRSTPVCEREIIGSSFPFSTSKLAGAKRLIREFQERFCDLMEDGEPDSIYQVEIAFYPVTRSNGGMSGLS